MTFRKAAAAVRTAVRVLVGPRSIRTAFRARRGTNRTARIVRQAALQPRRNSLR
jgi:hypothetical protein